MRFPSFVYITSPVLGVMKELMIFNSVDFPEPLFPRITVFELGSNLFERDEKTLFPL